MLLKYDPTRDLPDVPIPDYADVQAFVDQDTKVTTGLDRVLEKARNKEPAYVNKLQEISEESRLLFFKSHHSLPLVLGSLTWNFILTVVVIYLI